MKIRCKLLVICLILITTFLVEPVSFVHASETGSGTSYDRYDGPPPVTKSEVKFEKKDFFDWFGLSSKPKENCIEQLILAHSKNNGTDFSLYNLVCDFELKTMDSVGDYTTSLYTYTIDMADYETGFIDDLLVRFNLKDDHFEHAFDYYQIVSHANGFRKLDITGEEKYFSYNTVISQADFYFVRKSDGKEGRVRRYKFTWDSDFWIQKCTKIEFSWYVKEENYEKPIDSIESDTGVDGFTSGMGDSYLGLEVSPWDEILSFFIDLPAAVIAFISGFTSLSASLKELILVIFPFIPGGVVTVFFIMIFFVLIIGIYKLVQGLIG